MEKHAVVVETEGAAAAGATVVGPFYFEAVAVLAVDSIFYKVCFVGVD